MYLKCVEVKQSLKKQIKSYPNTIEQRTREVIYLLNTPLSNCHCCHTPPWNLVICHFLSVPQILSTLTLLPLTNTLAFHFSKFTFSFYFLQNSQPMSQIHNNKKKHKFPINDHNDILIEILQRLDGRALSSAACVCRQWCSIVRSDSLWEHLCFRQLSPPPSVGVRSVVLALGGYRRLYMVCVRPVVMSGLKKRRVNDCEPEVVRRVWNRHEVELSLSLFCVEYYERLLVGGGVGESTPKSLKFLCKAVNVGIQDPNKPTYSRFWVDYGVSPKTDPIKTPSTN